MERKSRLATLLPAAIAISGSLPLLIPRAGKPASLSPSFWLGMAVGIAVGLAVLGLVGLIRLAGRARPKIQAEL